ncbi:MAG: malate dehydrogenase (oxaloacetate-decarboxylating) [Planctomycetota bacterium]|jgi:malate dehydrogenase (oxaloacetate-decarboxylating)
MNDPFERSLELHRKHKGKLAVASKVPLETLDDLSLAYSPGVARPCEEIAKDKSLARELTLKGNSVAIITDGSAVLGLGNIGPEAALPVMEGKALLFKEYADIDAWPLCLATQDVDEIVETVRRLAPTFSGINLEDISAPRCFEIEARLQDLGIPVFHDDQHGTAIVLLAALLNAAKVTGREPESLKVVINGAGAAGTAIAKLLRCVGYDESVCNPVADVIICDSRGAIGPGRNNLSPAKLELLGYTNRGQRDGDVHGMLEGADVFIGVSVGNVLNGDDIRRMAPNPIIFPMANPTPEIMPKVALEAGAAVVGTGRSDFPNQVNNVLAFPGIFRGALNARAPRITSHMMLRAAHALAACVPNPTAAHILPSALERETAPAVARAVAEAAAETAAATAAAEAAV